MDNQKLDEVLKEATTAGPASEDQLVAAEQKLNVTFPKAYREFLLRFGAVMGKGFEIAGVFKNDSKDGPPLWRSIVSATTQVRRVQQGMLPETLLPITDDGRGVTYYLDVGNEATPEGRVVAYGPGIAGRVVSDSFNEFVVKCAKGELEV